MTEWSPATGRVVDRLDRIVERNRPLAPFTTYRVGGPAAGFVAVTSVRDLEHVREALIAEDVPPATLVVGRGSNLLVADAGFDGLVLHLEHDFEEIAIDRTSVRVGAAASLPVVARRTAQAGLTGFEWAVGVPGSVGGAVRMNAGGHGSDIAASLVGVSMFDLLRGGPEHWTAADLDLAYRSSAVGARHLVLFADFELMEGDAGASADLLAEIVRWRRANQPGGQNAGSVFRNPDGDSAGRLIEAAGLKGQRLGTATVSEKHANFIQADPDGSADDVRALIELVRQAVLDRFGIELHPENQLVGFEGQVSS